MRFAYLSFAGLLVTGLGSVGLATAQPALADEPTFNLTLKDHHFTPAEVTIPANTRVKFIVKNADTTPAEFESDDFKAEKVIPAGREVTVIFGPLKPGYLK